MPEVPAIPGPDGLRALVAEAFADDGPLAKALPAFEPRPGQREMAVATSDIFEGGGVLLAEAGTGTGKTLAYLVPAILSGRRCLISTGTKNLQDQIYYKDLPALRDALNVPFTATYMKGRGFPISRLLMHWEGYRPPPAGSHHLLTSACSLIELSPW